jgi:hypothetical protein
MKLGASLKTRLYMAGITGLGSGAARSSVWLYKSWGMSELQFWTPALVTLGQLVFMAALIRRVFIDAADEADPLKGWLESHQSPPPQG